ncbi:uncharacterized protein BP5553_06971 [Venustampulla echinocandica]|uniref:MARVEL domain-containing protein n=1 Tax=Venustampulla echinocandica TaxID=2656787 RepID=A0A370TI60_9HELO|nr:uncharacterized protein BP5553_06971 [Venustampulla echinocandica]RDL35040.1 hypothetical protein BP5553_06971 [Venustampulla echinocandica]
MIVTLALRVLQLLFGAVVLALSIVLIKGYGPAMAGATLGKAPEEPLMDYGAFCGAAGILIAAIGIAATFFEKLQGIVMLALDGLASFFLFAGAVAYAAKVGAGSCTDETYKGYLVKHFDLFRPSIYKEYHTTDVDKRAGLIEDDIHGRCREFQANTAFIWFMFACFVGTFALGFLAKSGRRGGAMV